MGKNDDRAPGRLEQIGQQRSGQLPDIRPVLDKDEAALDDEAGDIGPQDEAGRKIRQIDVHLALEDTGIEHANTDDRDRQAQRDPERTQGRASIAQPDVLQSDVDPELPRSEAVDEVAPRARHLEVHCRLQRSFGLRRKVRHA